MTELRELDIVRVVRLLHEERTFVGTDSVMRAPGVGDVGTVVHVYATGDDRAQLEVEMVDGPGMTVWLATFERSELQLVQAFSEPRDDAEGKSTQDGSKPR